ncbi:MAG: hypothetical protein KatS3mg019_1600 [Fimbriimonadales bacterium]|nr:MAG: hypothetical protein KatS3mg019_1600 [Fimbriimonadales bacterium]
MQLSERLRKALRAFHFRRVESQIREELAAWLECPAELLSFVDWDEHDQVLQQYSQLCQATTAGRSPKVRREWWKTEQVMLEKSLAAHAAQATNWTGYVYIPQYLIEFIPYRAYETCEVPMLRVVRFDKIFLRATYLLNHPNYFGYFECIFSDLANAVCFDLSEAVDYQQKSVPIRLELYSITGLGLVAADWVSQL